MNGYFIGFHQLVQKLELITPIISTLHDSINSHNYIYIYIYILNT